MIEPMAASGRSYFAYWCATNLLELYSNRAVYFVFEQVPNTKT